MYPILFAPPRFDASFPSVWRSLRSSFFHFFRPSSATSIDGLDHPHLLMVPSFFKLFISLSYIHLRDVSSLLFSPSFPYPSPRGKCCSAPNNACPFHSQFILTSLGSRAYFKLPLVFTRRGSPKFPFSRFEFVSSCLLSI